MDNYLLNGKDNKIVFHFMTLFFLKISEQFNQKEPYMMKKIFIILITLLIFLTITVSAREQKTINDILYGELKQIESFGYVYVKVQADNASILGLNSEDLTDYARLKYKNNFSGIDYKEIPAEESNTIFQQDMKAKKIGSIWFRVWTVGEGFPIAYYIECKAGNYKNYALWRDEVLGYCKPDEMNQVARNEIKRMIENFAIIFFKIRDEI